MFSDANIDYLEAPLTGGVTQASEGKLGAILGGTEDAVKKQFHYFARFAINYLT